MTDTVLLAAGSTSSQDPSFLLHPVQLHGVGTANPCVSLTTTAEL